MDNKKELELINNELTEEYKKLTQGGFNNQIMWNSYVQTKLAQFEQRLRHLEKANGRTQSFIGRNTTLK